MDSDIFDLIKKANEITLKNHGNLITLERAVFLSWWCDKGDCAFCYMSTQKEKIKDPKKARRNINNIYAEAEMCSRLDWNIEFLSGGYESFSTQEIKTIATTIKEITGDGVWLNTGITDELNEYGSEINGSGSLDRFLKESTYEAWLNKILSDMDIANIPESRVPGLTYFYVREEDERIIGMINIRLALNGFLRAEGGHIGYSIRPTERRKHYATEMLAAALKVCDVIGIKEVLVSCDKNNPASAGVIRNCGGILKHESYSETFDEILQMFVINR